MLFDKRKPRGVSDVCAPSESICPDDVYFSISSLNRSGKPKPKAARNSSWRMPRTVLQSNWYYRKQFDVNKLEDRKKGRVETYRTLSKGWFDQVPCGSTHDCRENFELTIEHCRNVIKPDRLKGFLMAPWYGATLEARRDKIMESLDVMGEAIAKWKQV